MRKTKKLTCKEQGREHTWETRGRRSRHGAPLFQCSTCTAWGWAAPRTTMPVQAYVKNPFLDRLRHSPLHVELTAGLKDRPVDDRSAEPPKWIDRRADVMRETSGATWYAPRYGLKDL
jgi:hypothetical protein